MTFLKQKIVLRDECENKKNSWEKSHTKKPRYTLF